MLATVKYTEMLRRRVLPPAAQNVETARKDFAWDRNSTRLVYTVREPTLTRVSRALASLNRKKWVAYLERSFRVHRHKTNGD